MTGGDCMIKVSREFDVDEPEGFGSERFDAIELIDYEAERWELTWS